VFVIHNIDHIITMDMSRRILRNFSIVVDGNEIVDICSATEADNKYRDVIAPNAYVDGRNTLVSPGFINTHAHTFEHLSRGLIPETVATTPWALKYFFPFQAALTEEEAYLSAKIACLDMLAHGTTCFIDSSILVSNKYVDCVVQAVSEMGIRAVLGRGFCDLRPHKYSEHMTGNWADIIFSSTDAAVADATSLLRNWTAQDSRRIRPWATIFGLFTFCTDDLFVAIKRLADEFGVGTNFHMASSLAEAEDLAARAGVWPITQLDRLGALGPNVLLTHALAVADHEIDLLASSGTKVAHCPGAALRLAKGATRFGKIPEMIASGVTVALGADGVCSCGTFDSARLMYLAAGLFKDARMDPTLIPAETALEMATINGAKALLWDDEIGSIEIGKKADFVQFDIQRPEWIPTHDVVRNLVYSADGGSILRVYVDGRPVVLNGNFVADDAAKLLGLAQEAGRRIARRCGIDSQTKWPITSSA
jgi:5-methylthioadenosine/S-adenosylhomocysteine deaminase